MTRNTIVFTDFCDIVVYNSNIFINTNQIIRVKQVSDIFDEVNEELKRDNMTEFWNKYKYAVYGVAGLLVVGIGSHSGYKEYKTGIQKENSQLFDASTTELASHNIADLKKIVFEGDTGYATISAFKLAQFHIQKGNYKDAADVLKPITELNNEPYSELAIILYALYSTENTAQTLAMVKPLSEPGKQWRHQALIVTAELALRSGDETIAKTALETLTNDATTPMATLTLARQIQSTLK